MPFGAGSSAAFGACAATTLLLVYDRISVGILGDPKTPGSLFSSHTLPQNQHTIAYGVAQDVHSWALAAESMLHSDGLDSGDTLTAVYGGMCHRHNKMYSRNNK